VRYVFKSLRAGRETDIRQCIAKGTQQGRPDREAKQQNKDCAKDLTTDRQFAMDNELCEKLLKLCFMGYH
jgi:hypothetical protein